MLIKIITEPSMPNIGTSKNILASRLKALVELGIFEIRAGSDGSAYKEYVLTDKGRSVFPVVVAMRQWGESICSRAAKLISYYWTMKTTSL